MKKYLKLLSVGFMCTLFMSSVSADKIYDNITITPTDTSCIKEDDEHFKNVKPLIQYIYGDTSIERCDNPDLELLTSIDACELEGWYLDEALTQKVTGTTIGSVMKEIEVKKDANGCVTEYNYITNVYAKCKGEKQCPVDMEAEKNLMYNNDGVITKVNVKDKQNLLTPTKEGYVFEGWYLDAAFTEKVDGNTTNALSFTPVYDDDHCLTSYKDITIYAKWKKQCPVDMEAEKNLMYNNDGVITKVNVKDKQNLLTPTKEGYVFEGWYLDAAFTKKVDGNTTDALSFTPVYDDDNCLTSYKDITIYAKWSKIPDTCTDKVNTNITLTYVINEKESKKATINVSSNENLLDVSRKGYKFAGWYYDEEFTNKVADLTFTQKFDEKNCLVGYEDITIYAKWEKQEIDKEVPKVDNPDTGDNIVLYVAAGVILLAGCTIVIKKLTNK